MINIKKIIISTIIITISTYVIIIWRWWLLFEIKSKMGNLITVWKAAAASSVVPLSYLWNFAQYFQVLARMSPQGKAAVIRSIQESCKDYHVFMCGDGGNDVGALKQVQTNNILKSWEYFSVLCFDNKLIYIVRYETCLINIILYYISDITLSLFILFCCFNIAF